MQSITIKIQIQGEKLARQQNHRKLDTYSRLQWKWECKTIQEKNMVNLTIWIFKRQDTNISLSSAAVEHNAAGKKPAGLNTTFRENCRQSGKWLDFKTSRKNIKRTKFVSWRKMWNEERAKLKSSSTSTSKRQNGISLIHKEQKK